MTIARARQIADSIEQSYKDTFAKTSRQYSPEELALALRCAVGYTRRQQSVIQKHDDFIKWLKHNFPDMAWRELNPDCRGGGQEYFSIELSPRHFQNISRTWCWYDLLEYLKRAS